MRKNILKRNMNLKMMEETKQEREEEQDVDVSQTPTGIEEEEEAPIFSKPIDEGSSAFATFIDIPETEEQYTQIEDMPPAAHRQHQHTSS